MSLLVGLNVRLFGPGHFSASVLTNFESALASLILWMHERHKASFVFFPLYKDNAGGDDEKALSRISAYLRENPISVEVCRLSSVSALLRHAGRCDAFIGVRYHSVIAAITAGIPVLGFDYGRKTQRLMTENGLGEFVLPVEEATAERLKRMWDSLFLRRDFIRRELAIVSARQKELALRHFDLIAKVLSD